MALFTTIALTVFIFGMLILVHELGHYLTARLFDVHILEFSIGMGPKIISRKSKKNGIIYSLRLLPIGGYVQMVGENGEEGLNEAEKAKYFEENPEMAQYADDPRALSKKPIWQRMIIIAAGGVTNIVIGLLLTVVMVAGMPVLGGTAVAAFDEDATSVNYGLQKEDIIVKVNNTSVSTHMMLAYSVMYYGDAPIDLTVVRGADIKYNEKGQMVSYKGGEKIKLEDVVFPSETFDEYGNAVYGDMDFKIYAVEKNLLSTLSQSAEYGRMMIKTVWDGLFDLIRGKYGIEAFSSPVGISGEIGDAAKSGSSSLLYIVVLLSVNLGIINLLPIPALDGGHLMFYVIELIIRRPISPKVKGYLNAAFMVLIFGFAFFIMFKDVVNLFI